MLKDPLNPPVTPKAAPRFVPESAMVLAAGIGKRMRPLTATTPKPLIEVAGRALIDHGLDAIEALGVGTVVVNVHYLADLVEFHVKARPAPRILISDERDLLRETGGGILKALPLLGTQPFLAWNADSFWIEGAKPNLALLADAWDDARMDALLLLAPTVLSIGYDGRGDFQMDREGRLTRRVERTVAPFAFCGAAIYHPRLFSDAEPGVWSMNRLFDKAMEAGRLHGVRMGGLWLHVGTPAAIGEAERAIKASID